MSLHSPSHGFPSPTNGTYPSSPYRPAPLSANSPIMQSAASATVPQLGKVRCYWAMLIAPYLHFVYLDPVLRSHLGKSAKALIGTRVCDWIHPDELKKAREDLTNFVQSRTVFGTVTRCRYTRLSQMRRHLGDEGFLGPERLDQVSLDAHWMPIELVMNWIGNNLVLCFFHAVLDYDTERDSIEGPGASDWTNWCGVWGGNLFKKEEINLLRENIDYVKSGNLPYIHGLSNCSYEPYGPTDEDSEEIPVNLFQIIRPDSWEVLLSWPPARPYPSRENLSKGNPLKDGGRPLHVENTGANYDPADFSRLVKEVCAKTNTSRTVQVESTVQNAKTSCTRRFRARHILSTDSLIRSIESVVIPYGALTFACFKMSNIQATPLSTSSPSESYSSSASPVVPATSQTPSRMPSYHSQSPQFMDPFKEANSVSQRGNGRGDPVPVRYPHTNHLQKNEAAAPHSYLDQANHAALAQYNMMFPGDYQDPNMSMANHLSANYYHAPLPLPAHLAMAQQNLVQFNGQFPNHGHLPNFYHNNHYPHPQYSLNDTSGLVFDMSTKRCAACGTANSPEWRRGPSGERDLCNACGLRFSRSQAKEMRRSTTNGHEMSM